MMSSVRELELGNTMAWLDSLETRPSMREEETQRCSGGTWMSCNVRAKIGPLVSREGYAVFV